MEVRDTRDDDAAAAQAEEILSARLADMGSLSIVTGRGLAMVGGGAEVQLACCIKLDPNLKAPPPDSNFDCEKGHDSAFQLQPCSATTTRATRW